MPELTEASLEAALLEMQNYMTNTGNPISLKPTKIIFRPSELHALGYTEEDILKMVKENNDNT